MRICIMIMCVLLLSSCANQSAQTSATMQSNLNIADYADLSGKMEAWGIGKEKNADKQPVDCVLANEQYGKYNAVFVGAVKNKIYLTFDNGYENGNTVQILDTLLEKNVQAVFFLTAHYIKENGYLVKRMIAEGHIIGNHGYSHDSFPTLSLTAVQEEIIKLHALMRETYSYTMTMIRPPKGEFSEKTLALSQAMGYETLLWSFAYYDYNEQRQPSAETALKKTLAGAHPGAIYLLHAISNVNMEILPKLIDGLRAQGYEVSDIDL